MKTKTDKRWGTVVDRTFDVMMVLGAVALFLAIAGAVIFARGAPWLS